jgi:hypothetical protein
MPYTLSGSNRKKRERKNVGQIMFIFLSFFKFDSSFVQHQNSVEYKVLTAAVMNNLGYNAV